RSFSYIAKRSDLQPMNLRQQYQKLRDGERGSIHHRPRGRGLDVALAYPNTYFLGMSNLGFQAVYQLFNSYGDVTCERVFIPDAELDAEIERSRTGLVTLESETRVSEFDVLAISVSFETDYLNIPKLLRLSGIPLFAAERTDWHPLVVLGGAAAFLNPEPVADFVDVVCVGEGEVLVPALLEQIGQTTSPDELLMRLAQQPGFYIPSFYDVQYDETGVVRQITPSSGAPRRVFTMRNPMRKQDGHGVFDDEFIPASEILTDNTEMSGRYLIEIS